MPWEGFENEHAVRRAEENGSGELEAQCRIRKNVRNLTIFIDTVFSFAATFNGKFI
jgi:hypothetical protein